MSLPYKKRTIHMPDYRSQQIALAATSLGIDSETFIQAAISAALTTISEHDQPLALMLARAGGAKWEELQELAKAAAIRQRNR